jgi:hypothetical protein
MATGTRWTETAVELGGVKLHLARAGGGRSLLVLHHDIGSPERLHFYDALAGHFEVIVPHHPGWRMGTRGTPRRARVEANRKQLTDGR